MKADAIMLKQTSSRLGHAVEINRNAGQILFIKQATSKQNFQPQRHTILVQVYVDVFPDTYRIVDFAWAQPDINCVCLRIVVNLHFSPLALSYEFIRCLQGFGDLVCTDLPLHHPLLGVMSIRDAHRCTSLSQFVRDHSFGKPSLLYRKSRALARPLSATYPTTMAISSSVNPYSSYTNASAFGVAIRRLDLALEHGHNVRRLPKVRRRGPSTNAYGTRMHE